MDREYVLGYGICVASFNIQYPIVRVIFSADVQYQNQRRVQQSERPRALAIFCVAGIGNFDERSRTLALLNASGVKVKCMKICARVFFES